MFPVLVSPYRIAIASKSVSADNWEMAMSLQSMRSLEHGKLRCLRRLILHMYVSHDERV
jgi:hypothetical protein